MEVQYDGAFDLATGKSRRETSWKNKEWHWSEFLDRIKETHRTAESLAEYRAAKVDRQAEIKDIGGFVGGYIEGGRRKVGSISYRQLVTLDLDFVKMSVADLWDLFCMLFGCAGVIYSTHKHTDGSPRLRLIIPLDRQVTPEEYIAISRRIAGSIGIDMFDDSTFEPSRLMYWPSTSKDGTYAFEYQDGAWLNADEMLASYKNWRDASEWSVSSRVNTAITHSMKKQGDPLEKPGLIGAFCRTYDIHQVIETYLAEEYQACDVENRYTYVNGSTAAGLVVYEDKFAYSHHGTDPCSGKLCNAFDLVRLHKFGLRDENCEEKTPINKLPSFLAMEDLVVKDKKVMSLISAEKLEAAGIDFAGIEGDEEDGSWREELEIDKKGNYAGTLPNIQLILENDPALKGHLRRDIFNHQDVIVGSLPWRTPRDHYDSFWSNADDAELRCYLAGKPWEINSVQKIQDAFESVLGKHKFHPIRDYLNGLFWDGVERLDTLYIDYFGTKDTELNRAMTRKVFTAAVARVMEPGTKFDYVLTIIGEEGKGKSSILAKMGMSWFSDTFNRVDGKEGMEQLQKVWLLELGELSAYKKADVETMKGFLSKKEDTFRPAFGRKVETFPRQCVFFATTNEVNFLRGDTGNRRFWPLVTFEQPPIKDIWVDLTQIEVNQLWAEAYTRYKEGEKLFLPEALEKQARLMQAEHAEGDERRGIIENFLNQKLPVNWQSLNMEERRSYFVRYDALSAEGMVMRDKVCAVEILNECFGERLDDKTRYRTREINAILKKIPGWRIISAISVGPYGKQRCYERIDSGGDETVTVTGDEETVF